MEYLEAPYGNSRTGDENTFSKYDKFKNDWDKEQKHDHKAYVKFNKHVKEGQRANYSLYLQKLAQLDLLGVYRLKDGTIKYTLSLSEERRDNHFNIIKSLNKYNVVARSAGSVSVSGSHSVVFGQPAIWLPIPLYTFVGVREFRSGTDKKFKAGRMNSFPREKLKKHGKTIKNIYGGKSKIDLCSPPADDNLLCKIYLLAEKRFKIKEDDKHAYEFVCVSEIPESSGLGGSGSLAVALSLALHYHYEEIGPEELTLLDWWLSPWFKKSCLYEESINLADYRSIPEEFKNNRGKVILEGAEHAGEKFESIRKLAWEIENILHGCSSGAAIHASMIGTPGFPLIYNALHYAYEVRNHKVKPQQGSSINGIKKAKESTLEGRALLRNILQIAGENQENCDVDALEKFLLNENSIAVIDCGEQKNTLAKQDERDKNLRDLYSTYAKNLTGLITPFLDKDGELKENEFLLAEDSNEDYITPPLRSLLRIRTKKTKSSDYPELEGDYLIDRIYKGVGVITVTLLGELIRDEKKSESGYYQKRDQVIKLLDLNHQFLSTIGVTDYKLDKGTIGIKSLGDFGCIMSGAGKSLLIFGETSQMQKNVNNDARDNVRMECDKVYYTSLFDTVYVSPLKIVAANELSQEPPSIKNSKPGYRYIKT